MCNDGRGSQTVTALPRPRFDFIQRSRDGGNIRMSTQTAHIDDVQKAPLDDQPVLAALDTEYQEAVKNNDEATMDRILADDFVLVTGNGTVYTKADLLNEAAEKRIFYERQEDSQQTVRLWGDTGVVTALLWAKGTDRGEPFEYRVWFSDTYVRTPTGWRYVLGQSGVRLPAA